MEEIWRDIPGYENLYQASTEGRIRSIISTTGRRARVLSPARTKWGYLQVYLTDINGEIKHQSVHKLVCITFVPIPEGMEPLLGTRYLQVNHKDEDKTNNRVENLEWVTPSYNSSYGTVTERRLRTHLERKTAISEARVRQLSKDGALIRIWKSFAEIDRETNFNKSYICLCCKGKYKYAYGYIWEYDDWRRGMIFDGVESTTDPQQCGSD